MKNKLQNKGKLEKSVNNSSEKINVKQTRIERKQKNIKKQNSRVDVDDSSDDDYAKSHVKSLKKLKDIDPEFYEFMKRNDKNSLKFNANDDLSDSEKDANEEVEVEEEEVEEEEVDEEEDDDQDDEVSQFLDDEAEEDDLDEEVEEEEDEDDDVENDAEEVEEDSDESEENNEEIENIHKPSSDLVVASDESDFEASDDDDVDDDDNNAGESKNRSSPKITMKILKKWQSELVKDTVTIELLKDVIHGFNAALLSVSGGPPVPVAAATDDKSARKGKKKKRGNTKEPNMYKVDGGAVFNGVIQLCVLHLQSAIRRFLGLHEKTSKKPHTCKKWKRIRTHLRNYLIDLTKLLENVSSTNILTILLKHLHQMCPMISSFGNITKPILKRLVNLWSTSEETGRVLAFLCILKITRNQQITYLSTVLKAMYLSYVRNSKFVSPNTLAVINFMRRSLSEMFALDLNVSYQHVFLYIRQLAIHLRNAITLKKKNSFQSVYNWQFINSLRLWSDLLILTANQQQLKPLVYPLVTIITGVIKLIPTAQYFPLRFHCTNILIELSRGTNTFIPVLPFIVEVLKSNTFNKRHTQVSMKPLKFTCILRLNKSQLAENGFRDSVIDNVFEQILNYTGHESASLGFPELIVPCMVNLKKYIKSCKIINYSRKLKTLCDKIDENSKFIENQREKISFTLKDAQLITAWETSLRTKGTPLQKFYSDWLKTQVRVKKRFATDAETIGDYNLPVINKNLKRKQQDDGPVELFPSDDDDDDDDDNNMLKASTAKKLKKNKKEKNASEIVKDDHDEDEDDHFVDDGVDIVEDLDLDTW